ncbi:MAG TPA: methyl-accepting chemotaxis protein [Burkholderiaceae bacterium]|nr:methyl-accepting chemotaxis protein [Burkholderiaceae bacterium]
MNRLKISTRLLLLIGMLSLLLVGIGGIGLLGIAKSNEALRSVYEDRSIPLEQIADIQKRLLENRLAISNSLLDASPEQIAANAAIVEANIAAISKLWETFGASALTPPQQAAAKTFADQRKRFVQEGLKPAVAALRAGDAAQARRLVAETIHPLYAPVGQGIAQLMQLQLDAARAEYTAAVQRYAMIRAVSIGSVILGLAFALSLGLLLLRGITRSLAHAADASRAVARGDLTQAIRADGDDEIARLLHDLAHMKDKLAQVVAEVRSNAESVASASAQIAQGNSDLSSRTEEQASSLEQTAASMDELGSTVRHNADNARQASDLAAGASAIAVKGGALVDNVVSTMKSIHDSSRSIGEIIGVIDSIAFQTNILALNAAVEAARAGESGRGFAVVASEVRALAQRSAEAARQIKSLIGASVERVEQGSSLVDQAGETMREIVQSIQRVTHIVGEISHANSEQSAGVAQVGVAVSQMDQATQQNAALVEQSAAAAESLKHQADQLVRAVATFKLQAATA